MGFFKRQPVQAPKAPKARWVVEGPTVNRQGTLVFPVRPVQVPAPVRQVA